MTLKSSRLSPLALAILSALAATSSASAEPPDAKQVATGEQIYADYCSNCHGDGLRNTSGGVTFDLRRLHKEEHDRFLHSVLEGKRQMPPWRGALEEQQIESIWAYIRATVDQ
jgi:mono/diheme cytochrome c family protein